MNNPLKIQVGGTHYKDMKIQPAELFDLIHMQPMAMMALKYVARWRKKNGQEDLKKAKHCLYLQEKFNAPRAKKVTQFLQQFPVAERAIMTEIIQGHYMYAVELIVGLENHQSSHDHHDPESTTD